MHFVRLQAFFPFSFFSRPFKVNIADSYDHPRDMYMQSLHRHGFVIYNYTSTTSILATVY